MSDITVKLSPAQRRFVDSKATIVAIVGPQGEGKTFAAFWGCVVHAQKFGDRVMRGAIIRDTFENIRTMTTPSLIEASQGLATFHSGGKKMLALNADIDLFGIDDLASLSKLQGSEYSFVHLEEPAPIAAKETAGLREEVFDIAFSRISRQVDAIPRLQIGMNPADEDHWTFRKLYLMPINSNIATTEVIEIPYGENTHLKDEQREIVKEAYRDRPDLYARYVGGKFSFIQVGEKVTPEYNEKIHRSDTVLLPNKRWESYRFWDGGLNPTCVFMQITPKGRMFFMGTLRGENIGMKQLIATQVKPMLNRKFSEIKKWRDIGDPSMMNREQSDSSQTAADVINAELGASFERGEKSWNNRREAFKELLNRNVDGEPMFLLTKEDYVLHRCLRGGWHYRKDNSGRVIRDKAYKDIHSHPGDAVSHGMAKILLRPKILDKLKRLKDANFRKYGITGLSEVRRSV